MSRWHNDWFGDWHHDWFGRADDTGPPGSSGSFDGHGDGGVATLILDLINGYTVTHAWETDVIKAADASEQRIVNNAIAKESYAGRSIVGPTRALELRALMARYAAAASRFMLAMPHEALSFREPVVASTVLPVSSTALSDWTRPGQRAVVVTRSAEREPVGVDVVIQSATSNTITVDKPITAPQTALIMPTKPVLLAPQQAFPRYQYRVEEWHVDALGTAPLDYAPQRASLALGPLTASASLAGAVVYAREIGFEPVTFTLDGDDGHPDEGFLFEGVILGVRIVYFSYRPGVTTFDNLLAALASSAFVILAGVTNTSATMDAGDEMGDLLTGATAQGDVGTGATLTEYEGLPVWDRKIAIEGTADDGVHSLTTIVDHGGAREAVGTAERPDWYRSVKILRAGRATEQWFKLFMHTVRGRAGKFWLPTWRADLEYVSHNGQTLEIGPGDFSAWWPRQRQHVMIEQGDGTITYAEITAASGTTLTISESLSASPVTMISWLEPCRFENVDSYETTHDQYGFSVDLIARVVP